MKVWVIKVSHPTYQYIDKICKSEKKALERKKKILESAPPACVVIIEECFAE